jgi:GDP-4-dehydro-6-deoxy-D-mannose reductase
MERRTPVGGLVVNVATGSSVAIRDAIAELCAEARVTVELVPDPELIRADDPPDLRGDATRLRAPTGWRPEIVLRRTLAYMLAKLSPGTRPS